MSEKTDPSSIPMLFLRIGWMDFYDGSSKIHGGGTFVRDQGYGHEMFNFAPFKGRMYGYVRPPRGGGDYVDGAGINLARIGASRIASQLDGVLAVWVSMPPTGGTYIVGWYRNATVYRKCQRAPAGSNRRHKGEDFGYYASCNANDARRLDSTARNFSVPHHRKGGIGQSNLWYADDQELNRTLRRDVLRYIQDGQLPPGKGGGISRQVDPLQRCKVEKAAIETTAAHFRGQGYTVASHEADNVGWDLLATYGERELHLEVKGLAGTGLCVELTPNEYSEMQKLRDSYYICVVTRALTNPELAVFGYSLESESWRDAKKRELKIEPVTGARCRIK